ncbi:MAG: response regulator transcription factor [Ktedonobacteraceae bacterium]|nr:response regulator transcription factor [Ktedonobacteraceae bacterium]
MERLGVSNISHDEPKERKPQGLRQLQILLVDSDSNAREKMQHALENGFVVHSVASVMEALATLEMFTPDILITEVVVGQESGLDLCRYVRNVSSLASLPIMLLTSFTTLQDKVAGFDAGADDYVVKPFDAHHLNARLRLLARIKRLEHHTNL